MYIKEPCLTATRATVTPIIKNEISPLVNAIAGQFLEIDIQFKSKIPNPIAKVMNTQMNIPISKPLSDVALLSELV